MITQQDGEAMKSRTLLGIAALVVASSVAVAAHAQPDESRYAKYDFQKLMKSIRRITAQRRSGDRRIGDIQPGRVQELFPGP